MQAITRKQVHVARQSIMLARKQQGQQAASKNDNMQMNAKHAHENRHNTQTLEHKTECICAEKPPFTLRNLGLI